MGIFNKIRGGAGSGRGDNPHQLKPAVGAKVDTHTVRDDSQNTTQAMTQRRADRDANPQKEGYGPGYLKPGTKPAPIKIGAEYTTYHESSSPEGKAILKDKKKTAKALKNVNNPKVMDEARAAGGSFKVAKDEETKRMDSNRRIAGGEGTPFSEKPSGSEAAFLEGGPKAEQAYRQGENRKRNAK
ncbi:hypothetical protein UFOVP361_79 [uncultured Caudovirales phage]|uniref:Uncharacterized protein n=1 Tax=uncultured Caudovirales phage TaxID=2100421 RepID=A0A6J7WVY7_9CAUD|nr:hypothetical protein UFOVP361_79 [uncultured Caudovirales phage]